MIKNEAERSPNFKLWIELQQKITYKCKKYRNKKSPFIAKTVAVPF